MAANGEQSEPYVSSNAGEVQTSQAEIMPSKARSRRTRLWVAVGILVVLAVTAVVRWWLTREAREAASLPPINWVPVSGMDAEALRAEALDVVERVALALHDSPDALHSKAITQKRFGDREVALACWRRCLEIDSSFALAAYCLGWDAFEQGEFEESIRLLREAVALDAKIDHAYSLLGQALTAQGRFEEAIGPLAIYTQRVPGASEGFFRLGQAFYYLEEYERAKQQYLLALEADPNNPSAHYGLANASGRLGRQEEEDLHRQRFRELKAEQRRRLAEAPIERDDRAALCSGVAFTHTDVGKVLFAYGAHTVAEKHWLRAAELDPKGTECRELLVTTYNAQGRQKEAVPFLRELSSIEPGNPVHLNNIGALSFRLREYDDAEQAYRKLQELVPHRYEGYAALAEVLLKAGRDSEEAKKLAEKAVELAPVADNYYLLGVARARSGDREKGIEALKRAIELDSINPDYREALEDLKALKPTAERPTSDKPEMNRPVAPESDKTDPDEPEAEE